METNLLEMMHRALAEVMESPVPDFYEDEKGRAGKLQQNYGLAGTGASFAKLCMCALVNSCIEGDVQSIKQVMALGSAGAGDGNPIGGVLKQLREHMAGTEHAGD